MPAPRNNRFEMVPVNHSTCYGTLAFCQRPPKARPELNSCMYATRDLLHETMLGLKWAERPGVRCVHGPESENLQVHFSREVAREDRMPQCAQNWARERETESMAGASNARREPKYY
eukprot:6459504-Amphidinium_carterae.1